MQGLDLSVFGRIKTKQDFDREAEEFALRRIQAMTASTGQDPAAVKLANEMQAARAAGDIQRLNDLALSAKIYDRGLIVGDGGTIQQIPGYAPGLAGISGAVKRAEADQANLSDLMYDPIAEGQKREAQNAADALASQQKKESQDTGTMSAIQRARAELPKATSGQLQSMGSATARFFGKSTEKTKADAQLKVIAAELVGNVPRFEGPQSNIDVQFYMAAAGDVANPSLTVDERLAALQSIEDRINLRRAEGSLRDQPQDPMQQWMDAVGQTDNVSPYANIPQVDGKSPGMILPQEGGFNLPKRSRAESEEALFNARKAIRNGANREAVIQRLIDNGIDPKGL